MRPRDTMHPRHTPSGVVAESRDASSSPASLTSSLFRVRQSNDSNEIDIARGKSNRAVLQVGFTNTGSRKITYAYAKVPQTSLAHHTRPYSSYLLCGSMSRPFS